MDCHTAVGIGQQILLSTAAPCRAVDSGDRSVQLLHRPRAVGRECGVVRCGVVWCAEGAVTKRQWPGCLPTGTGKREGCVVKYALCASVVLYSRDQCTVALGRCCSADACARHTGSVGPTAPCVLRCTISTLCAVLHYLVLCTALHCACRAALHLWAVGSGSVAMHCHTACGQGAVELLQLSAALPVDSGHRKSCNALPHCLGAVELLQCTATLPVGSGQ